MKRFAQAPGLPGFQQSKTYAAHRVWKGSVRGEVRPVPLSDKDAGRLYRHAQRFEEQTRGRRASAYRKGIISRREGVIGLSGLSVLYALLFRFRNSKTGRIDPGYDAIARAANCSRATAARALARLKAAGILNWVKRCGEDERQEGGGWIMRQVTNFYGVLAATGWAGYRPAPEAPPPDPQTWGAAPGLPALGLEGGEGAQRQQIILEGSTPGGLGAALAGLARRRKS